MDCGPVDSVAMRLEPFQQGLWEQIYDLLLWKGAHLYMARRCICWDIASPVILMQKCMEISGAPFNSCVIIFWTDTGFCWVIIEKPWRTLKQGHTEAKVDATDPICYVIESYTVVWRAIDRKFRVVDGAHLPYICTAKTSTYSLLAGWHLHSVHILLGGSSACVVCPHITKIFHQLDWSSFKKGIEVFLITWCAC